LKLFVVSSRKVHRFIEPLLEERKKELEREEREFDRFALPSGVTKKKMGTLD
jgi:hypothetical protein